MADSGSQLDYRIPSMLIMQDGLMNTSYGIVPNFERLLSGKLRSISENQKAQALAYLRDQQNLEHFNAVVGCDVGASWPPQSQWHRMTEQNAGS